MKVVRLASLWQLSFPMPLLLKAEEGAEVEVAVAAAGPLVEAQVARPLQFLEALARLLLPQAQEVPPPAQRIRPGQLRARLALQRLLALPPLRTRGPEKETTPPWADRHPAPMPPVPRPPPDLQAIARKARHLQAVSADRRQPTRRTATRK